MNGCLNCGKELAGPFCAACGQRAIPADPSVREIAGDAWEELSGLDGRIAASFRALLHPGRLTSEYIGGRRIRYLPPVRLYLIVSVMYFVVSAAAPQGETRENGEVRGPGGMRIGLTSPGAPPMTDEDRAEVVKQVDRAPWLLRPVLRSLADDPPGFRTRIFTIMPRVFFALLPIFAAIVSLFYRGRRFPVSLVFAVHLHAFAFLIFTLSEATKFFGVTALNIAVSVAAAAVFLVYALSSVRMVFGGGWPVTLAKAAGIGIVYLTASIPAFLIILVWASWT